jgi:fibronectin type 3 domain-containing protein
MHSIQKLCAALLSAVLLLCVLPMTTVNAQAAEDEIATVSTTSNERAVYDYLTGTLGLGTAAACGVMGNIYCESRFTPTVYNSACGAYGICQWTSSRLSALKRNYPSSYSTLSSQLAFLGKELNGLESNGPTVLKYLKSLSNSSSSAADAALYFAKKYERCGSGTYSLRQQKARDFWNTYSAASTLVSANSGTKQLSTPSLTGVESTTSGVEITWGSVKNAAKYRVFRKVSGGSWERLGTTSSTSYTDTTAKSGTTYAYTVRCLSADGKSYTSSYDSKGKSITYVATPTLTGISNTASGVEVTWSSVKGAAKYRVFRKVSGGKWTKVGDTTATSFTDTTAQSGTAYLYTVRCLSTNGKSYTSSFDSKGKSITYVAAPTLTGAENTTSGVEVTWSSVKGATKYRVFRKVSGGKWTKVGDTTATSFTDTTAKSGTAYLYTVRCLSANGKSYTSSFDSKGVSITYVATPTLTGISNTASGVEVTWDSVKGAAQYRVFRKVSGGKWTKIGDTSSTSFTDTTAQSGTAYLYTVRCLSADGKSYTSSFDSKGVSITYVAAPTPAMDDADVPDSNAADTEDSLSDAA